MNTDSKQEAPERTNPNAVWLQILQSAPEFTSTRGVRYVRADLASRASVAAVGGDAISRADALRILQDARERGSADLRELISELKTLPVAASDGPICVCAITPSERCPIHAALVNAVASSSPEPAQAVRVLAAPRLVEDVKAAFKEVNELREEKKQWDASKYDCKVDHSKPAPAPLQPAGEQEKT